MTTEASDFLTTDEIEQRYASGSEAYLRKNFEQARRDFELVAIEPRARHALVPLGWIYENGEGGPRDVAKAIECYAGALEGRDGAEAALRLSILLIAERRGEEAIPFLRDRAALGDPTSAMQLHTYLNDTPQSPVHHESRFYLERAASLGHQFAIRDLALMKLRASRGIIDRSRARLSLWKIKLVALVIIIRSNANDPRVR